MTDIANSQTIEHEGDILGEGEADWLCEQKKGRVHTMINLKYTICLILCLFAIALLNSMELFKARL